MHESAIGTKRTFRDVCLFVRFRGKADIAIQHRGPPLGTPSRFESSQPLISAGVADALDYKRAMISISGDLIAFDVLLSIFNGNGRGGSSLCGEGCAHASEVPISFALRPRIHSTSGRPEASSGNSRMAVAARACQHCAAHRAGRAGRGTARRTQAPLTHALIGLTRSTN